MTSIRGGAEGKRQESGDRGQGSAEGFAPGRCSSHAGSLADVSHRGTEARRHGGRQEEARFQSEIRNREGFSRRGAEARREKGRNQETGVSRGAGGTARGSGGAGAGKCRVPRQDPKTPRKKRGKGRMQGRWWLPVVGGQFSGARASKPACHGRSRWQVDTLPGRARRLGATARPNVKWRNSNDECQAKGSMRHACGGKCEFQVLNVERPLCLGILTS